MLTSLDAYFFSNCFEWLNFAWQFAPLSSGEWPFLSTNISQDSVAMHWRNGGIYLSLYYKFTANSVGKSILRICQYLPKLLFKKSTGLFFRGHSVFYLVALCWRGIWCRHVSVRLMSVCPSVRYTPVLYQLRKNVGSYKHHLYDSPDRDSSFRRPMIATKFRPLMGVGRQIEVVC